MRAPRRVRRSEQLGSPIWPAGECVRPGQADKRLRHDLWVTELLRGGEALDMPGARAGRVAALLGDEAEFGQRDGAGHVWFGAYPLARAQHVAYVGFGVVELAFAAGRLAEAQLREDLPGLVALLGREPHAPFQELAGLAQVTGPQRAPAQPRQRVGGLR